MPKPIAPTGSTTANLGLFTRGPLSHEAIGGGAAKVWDTDSNFGVIDAAFASELYGFSNTIPLLNATVKPINGTFSNATPVSVLSIQAVAFSNPFGVFSFTLISGPPPTLGQLAVVTGTTGAGNNINGTGAAVAPIVALTYNAATQTGTFTVGGASGSMTTASGLSGSANIYGAVLYTVPAGRKAWLAGNAFSLGAPLGNSASYLSLLTAKGNLYQFPEIAANTNSSTIYGTGLTQGIMFDAGDTLIFTINTVINYFLTIIEFDVASPIHFVKASFNNYTANTQVTVYTAPTGGALLCAGAATAGVSAFIGGSFLGKVGQNIQYSVWLVPNGGVAGTTNKMGVASTLPGSTLGSVAPLTGIAAPFIGLNAGDSIVVSSNISSSSLAGFGYWFGFFVMEGLT